MFMYISRALDRHPVIAVFLFLLPTITVPVAFAQGPSEELEDEEAADREMGSYASGNVLGVNPAAKTLAIRDEAGDVLSFVINRETTFTSALSLSDIRAGDYVTVDYFTVNGNNIADNVLLSERGSQQEGLEKLEKVLSD